MQESENCELHDELTLKEIIQRDALVSEGITDCKNLLWKQKTLEDYFFYEGSIDGFEECKKYSKLSNFEKRLEELHWEEMGEISKSSISDEFLKEQLNIYNKNEKTDYKEVFRIKGMKTQINFVYEKLIIYKALMQGIKTENILVSYF